MAQFTAECPVDADIIIGTTPDGRIDGSVSGEVVQGAGSVGRADLTLTPFQVAFVTPTVASDPLDPLSTFVVKVAADAKPGDGIELIDDVWTISMVPVNAKALNSALSFVPKL